MGSCRRYQKATFTIRERSAQAVGEAFESYEVFFPDLILSRRCRRPVTGSAGRFHTFELLSLSHELCPSGLGEAPHAPSNLRIRQRTFGITLPYVPNEILVIDDATTR